MPTVQNVPTRIQPVYPQARRASGQKPVQVVISPEVKGFFHDVWVGASHQMAAHGNRLLHPVDTVRRGVALADKTPRQMFHMLVDPYTRPIRNGHPGRALGRLLANAAVVAGAVLGGRFLLGRLGWAGGGASVGVRGPIGVVFDGAVQAVGRVVSGARQFVGGLVSRVGDLVRAVVGGGAHVG